MYYHKNAEGKRLVYVYAGETVHTAELVSEVMQDNEKQYASILMQVMAATERATVKRLECFARANFPTAEAALVMSLFADVERLADTRLALVWLYQNCGPKSREIAKYWSEKVEVAAQNYIKANKDAEWLMPNPEREAMWNEARKWLHNQSPDGYVD